MKTLIRYVATALGLWSEPRRVTVPSIWDSKYLRTRFREVEIHFYGLFTCNAKEARVRPGVAFGRTAYALPKDRSFCYFSFYDEEDWAETADANNRGAIGAFNRGQCTLYGHLNDAEKHEGTGDWP